MPRPPARAKGRAGAPPRRARRGSASTAVSQPKHSARARAASRRSPRGRSEQRLHGVREGAPRGPPRRPRRSRSPPGSADDALATTGVPQAMASSAASPKVSAGPGPGTTSAEAWSAPSRPRSATCPRKVTGSPRSRARCSSRARSGPSPATTSTARTPAPRAAPPGRPARCRAASPRRAGSTSRAASRRRARSGPRSAAVAQRGMPRCQVDAERSPYDVAGADPHELPLGELGGAHDRRVGVRRTDVEARRRRAGRPAPGRPQVRSTPSAVSWETITAGTRARRAHLPVQRSVVRSETSRRSGARSSRSGRDAPPVGEHAVAAGAGQQRPGQGDHPALLGLARRGVLAPGTTRTGSCPAAR